MCVQSQFSFVVLCSRPKNKRKGEIEMKTENSPKMDQLLSTSVSGRTKWDRKTNKKLCRRIYVARLIYLDATGKKREKTKEFPKKKDADDYIREQEHKFKRSGGREIEAEKMTFDDLADFYEKHYAKVAEYAEDRKITGLRSLKPVQGYIRTLRTRFGKVKLNKLTHGHIRDFRAERLNTPVVTTIKISVPLSEEERTKLGTRKRSRIEYEQRETNRKIASVNRELMTFRRIFNVAQSEGWIAKNPFQSGPSLISMADEKMRTRVLTVAEENRLLEACDCEERWHLKAIIVCLLDTGLRLNEALTLTWQGVDPDGRLIHITAFNSKTAKPKTVIISPRLRLELFRLRDNQSIFRDSKGLIENDRVFGVENNVNRSWRTARKLAGLEDVRLHDLRHTFGTRLNRSGFTQADIARLLGHQQVHTTFRYTNAGEELLERVERFHVPAFGEE